MKTNAYFIEPGEVCSKGLTKTCYGHRANGHIGGNDDRLPALLAECARCMLPLMQVVAPDFSDRRCATITTHIRHYIRQVMLASSPHAPAVCLHSV